MEQKQALIDGELNREQKQEHESLKCHFPPAKKQNTSKKKAVGKISNPAGSLPKRQQTPLIIIILPLFVC